MTRRDYTNASGYFCPTENTAIYLADREPQPKDDDLKRVRNLYAAICSIAAMMDMRIDDITIKVKGDSGRYKTVDPARTIERVEV